MMALKLTALFLISASGLIDAMSTGYTSIRSTRGGFYKLHMKKATWADAASTCRSEGARLFHPDSAEELEIVWRTLDVDTAGDHVHSGISDTDHLHEYVTVDGRPLSQVFNKWRPGEPISGDNNQFRCGNLWDRTHHLFVYGCDWKRPFICKHEEEETATDVTTVTAVNASYVAALEQQLANRTAAIAEMQQEIEAMKKVHIENQPCVLVEKIVAAIENQTAEFKQIAVADANQAAALDRLTEALQRHGANQTAAMEKLAGPQEDNEQ